MNNYRTQEAGKKSQSGALTMNTNEAWENDRFIDLLAPEPELRTEVQKLCDKLAASLNIGEHVAHADYNIPRDSRKKMLLQMSLLSFAVIALTFGRGLPPMLCIVMIVGAVIASVVMYFKATSATNLWAITNQRIIRVSSPGAEVISWPMAQVRLYGPRVEGGCIAFYMGVTTMSRVTMYFPRNPDQMLKVLVDEVNRQNALQGKLTPALTINQTPRWQQEAAIAAAIGSIIGTTYFMFKVSPTLQDHLDPVTAKQMFVQYMIGSGLACAVVWSGVYGLFRRQKR